MLDRRKTYVIDIEDRDRKGLNLRDNGEDVPALAIKAFIDESDGGPSLFYWDIGAERGHLLPGKVKKNLPDGIVFRAKELNWDIKLTELTMEQFESRIRPSLMPEVSAMLNDLDDVYTWYRQRVGIN